MADFGQTDFGKPTLAKPSLTCGCVLCVVCLCVCVCCCEREGIVGGDEGPVGGVAQVVCHGVIVVGVHGEEGQEKTVNCGER